MDKKYITLFKELAQATATSAETVMDYNREKGDIEGLETATIMRNDYQTLTDKISEANDKYVPTKNEAAKLLVGAMIVVNQLQDKINNLKMAVKGYQIDLIPKLQEIVDGATTDDEASQMAEAKFILEDNK